MGNNYQYKFTTIRTILVRIQSISVASADVTLSIAQGAVSNGKNLYLKLTGTLAANRNLIVPDSFERVYVVEDATTRTSNSYTLTVKTASGTGIVLPSGSTSILYSDGTNIVKANEYRKWRAVSAAETVQAGAKLLVNTNKELEFDT